MLVKLCSNCRIKKYLSKIIELLFFCVVLAGLFITSRWVDRDLYVKHIVGDGVTSITETPVESGGISGTAQVQPGDDTGVEPEGVTGQDDLDIFKDVTTTEMLSYLTDKYGEDFVPLRYDFGGLLTKEGMSVYPQSGSDYFDKFTIQKQSDGTYKESYAGIYARNKYRETILGLVNNILPEVPVYCRVRVTLDDFCDMTKQDVDSLKVKDCNIYVALDGSVCEDIDIKEITDVLSAQMLDTGFTGMLQVVILNVNDFSTVSDYSFEKYNTDEYIISQITMELASGVGVTEDD